MQNDHLKWLLRDKYGWTAVQLATFFAAPIDVKTLPAEIQVDVARLEKGEPLAYVIGWTPFLNCKIDLQHLTLIPRPETEWWVGEVIKHWKKKTTVKVLDLCCGSGCVGVAFAKAVPQSNVDFADIDPKAIAQTRVNVELNSVGKQLGRYWNSDLYARIKGRYDLILSNPPYVNVSGQYGVETTWEPHHALFAQKSGFGLIEEIISESKNHLNPSGELWIEIGEDQGQTVRNMLGDEVKEMKDQFGKERVAVITESALRRQS